MKLKAVTSVFVLATLAWLPVCRADELAKQQQALAVIQQFASSLCDSVKAEGKTEAWDVSAEAKAQLNGVVKKLADLGVGVAGKYTSSEYQGVLQADLSKVLADQTQCKLQVFNSLKDKLIPSLGSSRNAESHSARNVEPHAGDLLESLNKDLLLDFFPVKINWNLKYSDLKKAVEGSGPPVQKSFDLFMNNAKGEESGIVTVVAPVDIVTPDIVFTSMQILFDFDRGRLQGLDAIARGGAGPRPRHDVYKPYEEWLQNDLDWQNRSSRVESECKRQEALAIKLSGLLNKPARSRAVYKSEPYLPTDGESLTYRAERIALYFPPQNGGVIIDQHVNKVISKSSPPETTETSLFSLSGRELNCTLSVSLNRVKDSGFDEFSSLDSRIDESYKDIEKN